MFSVHLPDVDEHEEGQGCERQVQREAMLRGACHGGTSPASAQAAGRCALAGIRLPCDDLCEATRGLPEAEEGRSRSASSAAIGDDMRTSTCECFPHARGFEYPYGSVRLLRRDLLDLTT